MDLGYLRSATRTEHEATEALMPLMSPTLTRELYIRTLKCIYPLLAGWEAWMRAHAPAEYADLIAGRERSPLIAQDLDHLDSTLEETPYFPAEKIPGLGTSPAAFLGAMYVIEGSTLGGQYIARHLEPLFGPSAYFRGYGEQTSARWKEFQAAATAVPEPESATVIEAAKAMFGVFGEAILPLSQTSTT